MINDVFIVSQPLNIRADVAMKCFQFDGVLHIKVLVVVWCALNDWPWLIFPCIRRFCNHLVMQEVMRKAEAAGNDTVL